MEKFKRDNYNDYEKGADIIYTKYMLISIIKIFELFRHMYCFINFGFMSSDLQLIIIKIL